MTDQILFDKLVYMDRLVRAGVGEDQARAHAEAMDEALREAVATKTDIAAIRTDMTAIRTDMREHKIELKSDISDLRASVKVMDSKIYAVLAVVVLSTIKLFWPH